MRSILTTNGLSIGYGTKGECVLFRDINLQVNAGDLVGVLGLNGTGKSTLLRCLAGFREPLDGEVRIDGVSLHQISQAERAQKLSVVLSGQMPVPHLTVKELVALGRHPHTNWIGELTDNDRQALHHAMDVTGVAPFAERKIDTLSDGERQKVMIARAFAQDTPLIILDEPAVHLDLQNRVEIFRLLYKMSHEQGKTVVMATHAIELALEIADQLIVMKAGTFLKSGTTQDLVANQTIEQAFAGKNVSFDAEQKKFLVNW